MTKEKKVNPLRETLLRNRFVIRVKISRLISSELTVAVRILRLPFVLLQHGFFFLNGNLCGGGSVHVFVGSLLEVAAEKTNGSRSRR